MDEHKGRLPPGVEAVDYWRLLEDRTAGTYYWDREADDVRWSPKLLRALGHADQRATNLVQVEELLHPEDEGPHREALARSMESWAGYVVDIRLRHARGDYVQFRVNGYWLVRQGLAPRLLIGFLTERTEVKQLRDQVTRIERLFRAFFDKAPAAVYMKDKNRKHIYGNAMAARIAGCTVEEFIAKDTSDLFDEETDRALEAVDRRVLERGETVVRHGAFETAAGETHYVYDTTFPLEDPLTGEKLIGGVGLDTTRQHRAELALAQSQKMEALGQLVGGIAHDFNNTLGVLAGNLDLIEAAESEDDVRESLDDIARGVERGARLTKQLLAYARKAVLSPSVADLNAVIGDLDRMLRRVLPASIAIETVRGGGLWRTRIDVNQVESAILNLALNARDAMPEGGKFTLETSNVRLDEEYVSDRTELVEPGRYVLLAVTDTGAGMSPDVVERAFDPFFTTKEEGKGTGMGLSMVEGLLRQIGGTARLYSEVGVGTTVKLYFPASDAAPVASVTATKSPPPGGSEHILLVEDDAAVRKMLRRQLNKLGYRVTEAESGDRAAELLAADATVRLVLTDIVMPGALQGPGLATHARQRRPDLPVIFMSGYPREAAIHGNGLLPDDVNLLKPIKMADLAKALRAVLGRDADS